MKKSLRFPESAPSRNSDSGPGKRSKYQVTLDRLAELSPNELRRLGQCLREHDAGEHMMKMISAGFAVKQDRLPETE